VFRGRPEDLDGKLQVPSTFGTDRIEVWWWDFDDQLRLSNVLELRLNVPRTDGLSNRTITAGAFTLAIPENLDVNHAGARVLFLDTPTSPASCSVDLLAAERDFRDMIRLRQLSARLFSLAVDGILPGVGSLLAWLAEDTPPETVSVPSSSRLGLAGRNSHDLLDLYFAWRAECTSTTVVSVRVPLSASASGAQLGLLGSYLTADNVLLPRQVYEETIVP
jgi:hypothetical protein